VAVVLSNNGGKFMISSTQIPETAIRREVPKQTVVFENLQHDSKQYVAVGDTIGWGILDKLKLYPNNRGGMPVYNKGQLARDENGIAIRKPKFASKTTSSVRKEFQSYSLSEYSVAKFPDGTHMFSEGESRYLGTLERYFFEPMSQDELDVFLNAKVGYSVVPEGCHIKDYVLQGRRSPHTTQQRVWNPDLAYGHVLHTQILPTLSDPCRKFYESHAKLGSGLGYMVYSMVHYPALSWDFYEMYSRRGKVNFNDLPGSLKLSQKNAVKLATAACQYYDYYTGTQVEAGQMPVNKLFINDGWMGLYLVDRVTEAGRLAKSNKILANQTVRHYSECLDNAPLLGGTLPRAKIEAKCEAIFKLLRKKFRKAA
jgi:hypothetical protein